MQETNERSILFPMGQYFIISKKKDYYKFWNINCILKLIQFYAKSAHVASRSRISTVAWVIFGVGGLGRECV